MTATYLHTFWHLTPDEIDRIKEECGDMVREISWAMGFIEVEFPSEEDYYQYITQPIREAFAP